MQGLWQFHPRLHFLDSQAEEVQQQAAAANASHETDAAATQPALRSKPASKWKAKSTKPMDSTAVSQHDAEILLAAVSQARNAAASEDNNHEAQPSALLHGQDNLHRQQSSASVGDVGDYDHQAQSSAVLPRHDSPADSTAVASGSQPVASEVFGAQRGPQPWVGHRPQASVSSDRANPPAASGSRVGLHRPLFHHSDEGHAALDTGRNAYQKGADGWTRRRTSAPLLQQHSADLPSSGYQEATKLLTQRSSISSMHHAADGVVRQPEEVKEGSAQHAAAQPASHHSSDQTAQALSDARQSLGVSRAAGEQLHTSANSWRWPLQSPAHRWHHRAAEQVKRPAPFSSRPLMYVSCMCFNTF